MHPADPGQTSTGGMTREALFDLMRPVDEAVRAWPRKTGRAARNRVLDAIRSRSLSYRSWDEATWVEVSRAAGPGVTLVDSAEAVAEMVAGGLAERGLSSTHEPTHHFCVTDAGETFEKLAGKILGERVSLEWVEVV